MIDVDGMVEEGVRVYVGRSGWLKRDMEVGTSTIKGWRSVVGQIESQEEMCVCIYKRLRERGSCAKKTRLVQSKNHNTIATREKKVREGGEAILCRVGTAPKDQYEYERENQRGGY